jgi:hypothetical protein
MNKTKRLLQKILDIEKMAIQQMVKDYPVGRHVSFTHGHHDRMGAIVDHNPYSCRVKIKSLGNREYWVDIEKLHE